MEVSCSHVASWGHLGAIWGHLGAILGPSWGHLGAILGALGPPKVLFFCRFFKVFCFGLFLHSTSAYVEASFCNLGARCLNIAEILIFLLFLHILGPSWGHLGAILGPAWSHLVAFLGPLGAILGPSWGLVRPSWALSGTSWGHLGRHLGPSGGTSWYLARPSISYVGVSRRS